MNIYIKEYGIYISLFIVISISLILFLILWYIIKSTNGFTNIIPTIFCIITIVMAIFCMAKAMSVIPVGFTYATYGGLTITAVTLFGVFKYNQVPNMYGIVGIVLIIIGVILLNTLGKTN